MLATIHNKYINRFPSDSDHLVPGDDGALYRIVRYIGPLHFEESGRFIRAEVEPAVRTDKEQVFTTCVARIEHDEEGEGSPEKKTGKPIPQQYIALARAINARFHEAHAVATTTGVTVVPSSLRAAERMAATLNNDNEVNDCLSTLTRIFAPTRTEDT